MSFIKDVWHLLSTIFSLLFKNENIIRLFKSNDPQNFKDGEQSRDFIYVKDTADIVCDLLQKDAYGIYNVGSGIANTWNSVASSMFKALEKEPNIEYKDMPGDLKGKYQNYTCADMGETTQ